MRTDVFAVTGCGVPQTCTNSTPCPAGSWKGCCSSDQCELRTSDGQVFPCNGKDCSAAASQVVNWCRVPKDMGPSTDLSSGGVTPDLLGLQGPTHGGPGGLILAVATNTDSSSLSATSVSVGGVAAPVFYRDDHPLGSSPGVAVLYARLGAGTPPGSQLVRVTDSAGASPQMVSFIVDAMPAPTVTALNPAMGASGTRVTVTGTGFNGATKVHFYGQADNLSTPTIVNNTTLTVAAFGSGAQQVWVEGPSGTADSYPSLFTVQ